ncbi:MAG: DUF5723 family protein [Bacteroidota bacterium]
MKTFEKRNFVAACMILLALDVVMTTTTFAGGDKYSPRLVGMGRAFTAFSRGLDAVGVNPANLALNDRDATVTINLVPLGFSIGSDLINLGIYNDYFTGVDVPGNPDRQPRMLTEADKDKILELFPSGIARTQTRIETSLIGFSLQIGNFGFAIAPSIQTAINLDLDKAYLEFPLRGYGAGQSYNFDGTAVNGQSVAEMNFSAAYMLPVEFPMVTEIAIGVGVKYLIGLAFIATDHYNGSITPVTEVQPDGSVVNKETIAKFDFLQWVAQVDPNDPAPVGTGLGLDFGISMRLLDNIQFAASITDIGSITWDKNTKAIIGNASLNLGAVGDKENQQKLTDAFKGKTVDTTGFTFDLPTAVNVGAAIQMDEMIEAFPFRWLVAVDGHFGLNEIGGNTKLPQFSVGTELDPLAGWLPLRTGVILGGRERFAWSAGFGIHLANTFDIDFATQSIAILTNPETFRTGSFTMGMRLRF